MTSSMIHRRTLLIGLAALPLCSRAAGPAAMLANVYRPGTPLGAYWVSEKFDGVRGLWNGQQLWSRHGHRIEAPAGFTAGWPAIALDGELWAGHGRFTTAASATATAQAGDGAWREMRYMVFDAPGLPGRFDQRLAALQQALATSTQPTAASSRTLHLVPQQRVADEAALQRLLRQTVDAGGEGLVLHRGDSLYRGERSDALLKLKPQLDAEATVIGQVPGKGKFDGMMGALLLETADGVRFRLGSGFSEAERKAPPAIGTQVTYRYMGLHPNGAPRFASYLRVRSDAP